MPGPSHHYGRHRPPWVESEGWGGFPPVGRPPRLSKAARLWIPVAVSLVVQVTAILVQAARHPEVGRPDLILAVVFALIGPLALIGARRFPGPVVAVVAAAATVDLLVNPALTSPYVALAFAIVLGLARGARIWTYSSVAVAWLTAVIGAAILGIEWPPPRIVFTTLGVLATFAIGEAIRGRRRRFAEFQASRERRRTDAAQQERVRIARELHDVLAHSLSQINVQAGVGLHLIESQPELAAESLASIKQTSKTALDEVRAVLGILRSEDGGTSAPLQPEADLARLPGLVDSMSSSALAISIDNHLTTVPPAAVQLALFRITQESLTNVVRHAGARRATVTLSESADDYVVRITDDGGGAGSAEPGGGLLGMRERAELLGGTLSTVSADTGFTVTATIPRRGSA